MLLWRYGYSRYGYPQSSLRRCASVKISSSVRPMNRTTILLLEDDADRVNRFESAVAQLGPSYRLRVWHDARRMIAECHEVLADTALISLDHDLNKKAVDSPDPGDGVEV